MQSSTLPGMSRSQHILSYLIKMRGKCSSLGRDVLPISWFWEFISADKSVGA